ncbi:DUF192 domain-containing protein [Sphingomonas psychrotolerans]|uniref:DUF192 domain-containing protein n=1 Tax=Sphingomonas psychrotolerans TaxID=1327635 RepID=A0ABU3N165_9SPHN|nr:DUF192 domain-containing protein [Sphingomonas psychrotolerans]MDT8757261.1 DUF192 domain-containing protein [Sphingomonas psychrotolerans]
MIFRPGICAALAAAVLLAPTVYQQDANARGAAAQSAATRIVVTVLAKSGPKQFKVEVARTTAQQERGLMFRTNIPADGGMIFTPYPAAGGGPRVASFWMKNTPTPLDIIFIRPNGTIESIAANAVPYSETPARSGAPVSAVLEINGGKSAELGIAPGDKVRWTDQSQ